MAITIFGAGAIGGTTGAALARAGHDVLLVDSNAPHVEAINAQGLTVEREGKTTTTRVPAVLARDLGEGLDLVMLAVKSHHTEDALGVLVPRLAAGGTVVSLQNGLSEEQIARAVGPARTVGCLVNWAADWVAPGRILHGGHGAFVLGELDGRITPRVKDLAALLSAVEPTPVTDNIWGYKWGKLIYGALLFGTALVDAHVYEMVERGPEVQRALVGNLRRVNRAIEDRGVKTAPFVVLVGTEMPAILAEVSCLSNDQEAALLGGPVYRQSIADALYDGIRAYLREGAHDGGKETGNGS